MYNNNCCRNFEKGDFNKIESHSKFRDVLSIIKEMEIPYSCDKDDIMICSPVGNEIKYQTKKADIVLSGYCTAPDAAIQYLKDLNHLQDDYMARCKNAFNTANMQRGISKLFRSLGFKDPDKLIKNTVGFENDACPRILFTQSLCMISPSGSSKANEVKKLLESGKFHKQANASLFSYYNKISHYLREKGTILLMGCELERLLKNSYIDKSGNACISFGYKLKGNSIFENFQNKFKIFKVYHASAMNRPEKEKKFYTKPVRKAIYDNLRKQYPKAFGVLPETVASEPHG